MNIDNLKACPHCLAPLSEANHKDFIGETGACQRCVIPPPTTDRDETFECRSCKRQLKLGDFEARQAAVLPDSVICIDCLRHKRENEREKRIFRCDICESELTQLDILEGEAVVRQMLVFCSSCIAGNPDGVWLNGRKIAQEQVAFEQSDTYSVPEVVEEFLNDPDGDDTSPLEDTEPVAVSRLDRPSGRKAQVPRPFEAHPASRLRRQQAIPVQGVMLGCLVFIVLMLTLGVFLGMTGQLDGLFARQEPEYVKVLDMLADSIKDQSDKLDSQAERLAKLEQAFETMSQRESTEPAPTGPSKPDNTDVAKPMDEPKAVDEITKKLEKGLTSKVAAERLNFVMEAYKLYNKPSAPILREIVERDSDPYVRCFAIKTLASFRDKQLPAILRLVIEREREGIVRDAARKALAELPASQREDG